MNTPKKTHKTALDNNDVAKMWDLVTKELNASPKNLFTKLINFNHAKLKERRLDWSKEAFEGVGAPSESAGLKVWKWIRASLGQPTELEEEAKESPVKEERLTTSEKLGDVTQEQFAEFRTYKSPPLNLIKTLFAV